MNSGTPSPLRSPAGRGRNSESESAFFPTPSWLRRRAQGKVDQGKRLFERSEFAIDPTLTEHRSEPVAKGLRLPDAFCLVTFFWRSKRK